MSIILGIDYGDKRIGLALSDPERKLARRFLTLKNYGNSALLAELESIIKKENIEKIVIGIPIGFNGASEQTQKVREFADLLKNETKLPLGEMNEIMTSRIAEENLRKAGNKNIKEILDQEAARIILQDYLDNSPQREN